MGVSGVDGVLLQVIVHMVLVSRKLFRGVGGSFLASLGGGMILR